MRALLKSTGHHLVLLILFLTSAVAAAETSGASYDIVVVGATPAGIAAAIAAARQHANVAVVEESSHVGAMFTRGGMTYSDLWLRDSEGALFLEYVRRVRKVYTGSMDSPGGEFTYAGYGWEPSVAEKVLNEMLADQHSIHVLLRHRLISATRQGHRLVGADFQTPDGTRHIAGTVFIDATYEGDLAAMAGVAYRLGRESRTEFNEQHGGILYEDIITKRIYPGSTGQADPRVQAYISLIVVTDRAANRVPIQRPPDYDRNRYITLLDDIRLGYAKTFRDFYIFIPVANGKFCLNNSYKVSISADFPEANTGYVEGDEVTRKRITELHQNHTLGLLYFLQNDDAVPDSFRQDARAWGLAADEFTDTGHLPSQLYVREGRRIVGQYTFTENDVREDPANQRDPGDPVQVDIPFMYPTYNVVDLPKRTINQRPPIHQDSIGVGTYFLDSHAVQRWKPGYEEKTHVFEGVVHLEQLSLPSQIPYRVIVPKDTEGLLVPVAVSASHLGFLQIRMEPVWMALGQAAGLAAAMSLEGHMPLTKLPLERLQARLADQGHVLTFYTDVPRKHPHFAALQYFGTKGFFPAFTAMPDAVLLRRTALHWLALATGQTDQRVAAVVGLQTAPSASEAMDQKTALAWTKAVYPNVSAASVPWKSGIAADSQVRRSEFCELLYGLTKQEESGPALAPKKK